MKANLSFPICEEGDTLGHILEERTVMGPSPPYPKGRLMLCIVWEEDSYFWKLAFFSFSLPPYLIGAYLFSSPAEKAYHHALLSVSIPPPFPHYSHFPNQFFIILKNVQKTCGSSAVFCQLASFLLYNQTFFHLYKKFFYLKFCHHSLS